MDTYIYSAENAGLSYINEEELCIYRKRYGKGFIYLNSSGKIIQNKKELKRFKSLIIPPAWEEVKICSNEKGHIQATGRDARGRKQYIYHSRWEKVRNTNKFNRIIEFAEALPLIRRRTAADLKKKSLYKDKVLAVIISLLEETLIRIGNKVYAEENNSYGLTTLKDKHIKINGINIKFEFNGKSGKELKLDLNNKVLAKIIKQCQDLPGQHLFQYIDENGNRTPVGSNDVNQYLNNIVEKNFTAKDFRTWGATVEAAKELYKLPLSNNEKENNRNIVKAVKLTAKALNNTPAICRKYYIHPHIIEVYSDGYLFKIIDKHKLNKTSGFSLNREEMAVLSILKKYSKKNKIP